MSLLFCCRVASGYTPLQFHVGTSWLQNSWEVSSETHYTLGIHCDAVRDVGSPGSKWERDCLSMIDDSREFG